MEIRCKACNAEFTPRRNILTNCEEDLCSDCLVIARLAAQDIETDVEDADKILDSLDLDLSDLIIRNME